MEDRHIERLVELSLAYYCLTVNPRDWGETDVRAAYAAAMGLERR